MPRWFVDTSYVVALANVGDEWHEPANRYAGEIERGDVELVTTEAVLLEVAGALAKVQYRSHAVVIVEELRKGAVVSPFSAPLLAESWEMYKTHLDKDWSWVDTISFTAMRREGISEALTGDHHFEQASFRALLRPEAGA